MNPRRILHWDRVRTPQAIAALFIGTAGGAGLFPLAPGTMGTLVGLPIAFWTAHWDFSARIALWSLITFAGTWACKEFDSIMGSHDNQNLVIDEVAGMGITAWTAGASVPLDQSWKTWLTAFLLFRFFDIVKIPPVRQIDRWSKTGSAWLGGFGVMADDLVAGVQGLLVMMLLQKLSIL